MKLKDNLELSRQICDYLLKAKKVEAANWDRYRDPSSSWEECIASGKSRATCVSKQDLVDICLYDVSRPKTTAEARRLKKWTMMKEMKIIAKEVERNRCGNCGELAVTAFVLLNDKKIKPLDFVSAKDPLDHQFVIIDRKPGDINDVNTWGKTAVICDPWAQGYRGKVTFGTYSVADFSSRIRTLLPGFKGLELLHRED